MKFIVENFQSIAYQEIEFSDFTILVGPSNLGKSALLRALRSLLFNDFDKCYIRKDQDICKLNLEFTESNLVEISKIEFTRSYTKSINEYKIYFQNGTIETFDKVGIETPNLIKLLGYRYIELERTSEKINVNFQNQLEGLFLLSSSEVQISSFFNKIFNVDRYENALRECNKDILNYTKDYTKTQKEISKLETDYSKAKEETIKIKSEFESISNIKERILVLEKYLGYINSIKENNDQKKIQEDLKKSNDKVLSTLRAIQLKSNLIITLSNYKISIKNQEIEANNFKKLSLVDLKIKQLQSYLASIKSLKIYKNSKVEQSDLKDLCQLAKDYLSKFNISSISKILALKSYRVSSNQIQDLKISKRNFARYNFESITKSLYSIIKLKNLKNNVIEKSKINASNIISYDYITLIEKSLKDFKRICQTCNQFVCK